MEFFLCVKVIYIDFRNFENSLVIFNLVKIAINTSHFKTQVYIGQKLNLQFL